jgi:hypothetical protein
VTERTPQRAYLDLQKLARDQGRNTQQLFELYIHERFLARVAESQYAGKLVLKGGMLLAVLDVRRGTRDADMLARGMDGDESRLEAVIGEIASIPMTDGVDFDTAAISIATIREGAEYEGIRLALPASLGGAELKLRLDLSFGDPVEPQQIDYPTLLDDQDFPLLGYPLESVIAEKADTMMLLGDANTRDRDYGDIYLLSQIHTVEAVTLRRATASVAEHRGHEGASAWTTSRNPPRESPAALGGVPRPRRPARSTGALRRCRRRSRRLHRRVAGHACVNLESCDPAVGLAAVRTTLQRVLFTPLRVNAPSAENRGPLKC